MIPLDLLQAQLWLVSHLKENIKMYYMDDVNNYLLLMVDTNKITNKILSVVEKRKSKNTSILN